MAATIRWCRWRQDVDTARHIRGARLQVIDGMGHDFAPALQPTLASMIVDHVKGVAVAPVPALATA